MSITLTNARGEPLDELIKLLENICHRLEAKPDRTTEDTLLLVDAKLRLAIAKNLADIE